MAFKHIVFDHDGTLVYNGEIFEKMKELLEVLDSRGINLYVWTARDRHSTLESLKFHGISKHFKQIATSTDAAFKPSPAGLNLMLEQVSRQEVCVVGDSSSDMQGAKVFGAFGIGANWLDGSVAYNEHLYQCEAKVVFESIEKCQEFLISKI